ncbi:unnamed protein product, partial [Mesorhabditis spiculigera]
MEKMGGGRFAFPEGSEKPIHGQGWMLWWCKGYTARFDYEASKDDQKKYEEDLKEEPGYGTYYSLLISILLIMCVPAVCIAAVAGGAAFVVGPSRSSLLPSRRAEIHDLKQPIPILSPIRTTAIIIFSRISTNALLTHQPSIQYPFTRFR